MSNPFIRVIKDLVSAQKKLLDAISTELDKADSSFDCQECPIRETCITTLKEDECPPCAGTPESINKTNELIGKLRSIVDQYN